MKNKFCIHSLYFFSSFYFFDNISRFPDEIPDTSLGMFKEYTQTYCEFECMLKYSAEMCRCVPWNFPPLDGIRTTCDAFSNYCFNVHMKNVSQLGNCDCLMDCNRLSFSYRYTLNCYLSCLNFEIVDCKG